MVREPAETVVSEAGAVEIPLGVLVEVGLDPGTTVIVYSDGDGRVVIRRQSDALDDILEHGTL
jgi:bifunctional DNA-binding transcriptional regulator/antitoxin component of YhaV-PrlF toxin-antitoxin module